MAFIMQRAPVGSAAAEHMPPLICDLQVLAVSRTPAHDSPEMSCVHGVVARLNGVRKPPLLLSIHASL